MEYLGKLSKRFLKVMDLCLTRMSCKNDGGAATTEKSVFAEDASKDDAFCCLVQCTENIVKYGHGLAGVDGSGDGL